MFHDALELFFDVAIAHRGLKRPKQDAKASMFEAYFDAFNASLTPSELPERVALDRLNKARVALKHFGAMPSSLDVEGYRATVATFLEASTPMLFELAFDSLSLSDLVSSSVARELVREAEAHMDANHHSEALEPLGRAFETILAEFEERRTNESGPDPFFFGWPMSVVRHNWEQLGRSQDRAFSGLLDAITGTLDQLQSAVRILALGLDMPKYLRFSTIVERAGSGPEAYAVPVTPEQLQYCRDYVVETALSLQQFEAGLENS